VVLGKQEVVANIVRPPVVNEAVEVMLENLLLLLSLPNYQSLF
jgi:hypothetical protein